EDPARGAALALAADVAVGGLGAPALGTRRRLRLEAVERDLVGAHLALDEPDQVGGLAHVGLVAGAALVRGQRAQVAEARALLEAELGALGDLAAQVVGAELDLLPCAIADLQLHRW